MTNLFLENLKSVNLENQTIVLAISTGVDSMVLLDLFIKTKIPNLKVVICHVNHQKRLQSIEEEAFIKEYSKTHNITLEVAHLEESDVKDNFQSDARNFRYKFFIDTCIKYNTKYLALAHHGQDQIETVLMRMLRGSSLSGYAGMKEVSNYKGITILRPLLKFTKEEIYDYAFKNKLIYFEDSSNKECTYTRNKLRHNVVNPLMKINPDSHKKFLEFSTQVQKACDFINHARDEFILNDVVRIDDGFEVEIPKLNNLHSFLAQEVLFELLKKYSLSKSQIEEIEKIISSDKANIVSIIKNTFSVIKEYDKLIVLDYKFENIDVEVSINSVGTYMINDILKINVTKNNSNFITNINDLCYNNYIYLNGDCFPLKLRSRSDGDKIYLNGGYKKVKDVLINKKIGITKRREALILEDSHNEILWITGVQKSAKLKNKESCEIKITLEGNNNNA